MKHAQIWSVAALVMAALIGSSCTSCPAGQQIQQALADDDNDGWYTKANNYATLLSLASGTFSKAGEYRIIVDEVRFPLDPSLASIDRTVTAAANTQVFISTGGAKRVHGTNIHRPTTRLRVDYTSTVTVQRIGLLGAVTNVGSSTVNYHSDGSQGITVTVGSGSDTATLTFAANNVAFADPNPNNANGDSDGDGIRESEEAILAEFFGGLGDPRPGGRDVVLIIGFTEPGLATDPFTRELLKSRFFQRQIILNIDDGTMNGRAGSGGLMSLGGAGVAAAPGTAFTIGQTLTIRNATLPAARRRFAYFALLAADEATGRVGLANNTPGNRLVMRARLGPLSPNFLNYQAGVLMHEVGHLLALCHPTDHDGTTCTAIPQAERDPGATVMGSAAETPGLAGFPAAVANTLSRPLDYTAAQWNLLRLGAGFGP